MHFTGRTWRPPYEAHSVILQAAAGCTYRRCRFCGLYRDEPFRLSPLEELEEDLAEIKAWTPRARRVFLTGGNPFAMSYEQLKRRALTIRDYLIKCQTIAMFASIRDIRSKELWQLKKLRATGINGLTIGTESGDDQTLALAGKGYTAADILTQCQKLDEAGIEYYFVYMTGLAGAGGGARNAAASAALFNRLNPRLLSVDSLTLLPGTELYDMARSGAFRPAGERERIQELQLLIRDLRLRVHLLADTSTNFYPVSGILPRERGRLLGELDGVLARTGEAEMAAYRASLRQLG